MPIMSLKKRRQLKKEQRQQAYRDALARETGLYFSTEIAVEQDAFPFLKYVVNALALFGSTYGALACLATAFHLDVSLSILAGVCAVLASLLSLMYANHRVKMLVYVLILIASLFLVGRYYIVINSGMSAIWNHCLKTIDAVFELPQLREYTVYYDNEYIAMTMGLSVLALTLMILLNIFVSEYMNYAAVFLITAPFVMAGLYFSFDASKLSMVCVMGSWILIAGVRATNSYNGLTRKLKTQSSVKKHKHHYGFVTDSSNVAQIGVVWLLFSLCVAGVLLFAVPQSEFELVLPTNAIKDSTNQPVKNFLSYGFGAFFSRENDSQSPGQIANSSMIAFDGQTDLKVRLVDYGVSRMYLRNYVGYWYRPFSYEWIGGQGYGVENDSDDIKDAYNASGAILSYDYEHDKKVSQSEHRIEVEVVDPLLYYDPLYVPYYAVSDYEIGDYEYVSSGEIDQTTASVAARVDSESMTYSYTFYTVDDDAVDVGSALSEYGTDDAQVLALQALDETGYENAIENAMEVPEDNIDVIRTFCDKYEIRASDEDVVSEVVQALEENYDYTLRPGKVPINEDYVNYFLSSSHKGYCVHFATAATLIFRYLGIPARYAEGYVLDSENYDTATSLEAEQTDDWIQGSVSHDSEVVEVSLTDANGHAWVEIYQQGLGWIPVEVTNSASIDGDGLLGNLFGSSSTVSNATQTLMNQVSQIDVDATKQSMKRLLLLLLVVLLVLYIARMLRIVIVRHAGFYTKLASVNVSNRYQHLYETWQYVNKCAEQLSYQAFIRTVWNETDAVSEADGFCEKLECALFSGGELAQAQYESIVEQLEQCRKRLVKNTKCSRRVGYFVVKGLW